MRPRAECCERLALADLRPLCSPVPLPSTCPMAPPWPCAGVGCGAVSGADPAAALLLEVVQDPGLEARYLQGCSRWWLR